MMSKQLKKKKNSYKCKDPETPDKVLIKAELLQPAITNKHLHQLVLVRENIYSKQKIINKGYLHLKAL